MRQFQGVRFAVLPVLRMKLPHSMILLLALIHDCNSSTQFTIYYITCVEIIVVPPNTGDGPRASESTGVSDALGTSSEHNDKHLMKNLLINKDNLRLYRLVYIWKKTSEKFKNVSDYVMEKVTPNVGLAFLALTIQSIYQMASSMAFTANGGKSVLQINGVIVVLLIYGLLIPKCAGGHLALVAGVLLASLVAVVLSFKN